MKAVTFFAFLIALVYISSGCGFGDWEIAELYGQKIEGTSKVLYKYDAWGGRDAHASGFVILDSTERFQVNPNKDLPFTDMLTIPDRTHVMGVSTDYKNRSGENYKKITPIFTPIKKESTDKQGFSITNIIYQYKGFAERDGGLGTYQFESFKETRDSIFFYDLDDVESMNGKHLDSFKLKKTDVCIMQSKTHEIIKIIFEDLIVDKNSYEIKSDVTYYLTPKHKLNSYVFSNYGIFKQIVK